MQFWQLAHGNRTALIEGTRTLSYDELGVLADTLAMHLPAGRGRGGPGPARTGLWTMPA